jgi:ketosteroid isomerase-like protein
MNGVRYSLRPRMAGEVQDTVQEANNEFYRALESGSVERMEGVWAHDDWVRCIHPGWAMITGWLRVRESWQRIFESGQKMRASPSDVMVHQVGELAWVNCTENITVFDDESFDTAQAAATNLFVQREGRWLMVHHHASPVPMVVSEEAVNTIQ